MSKVGSSIFFTGRYDLVYKDQSGKIVWREYARNGVLISGLTDVLEAAFNQGSQRTWHKGLIDNTNYSGIDGDDTISSHAGWQEFENYEGITRKQWTPLSVSGGLIFNTSPVEFTFSAAGTVRGIFLVSSGAKGSASGVLFSTALFSTSRTVAAGGTLTVTYALRAAGGN